MLLRTRDQLPLTRVPWITVPVGVSGLGSGVSGVGGFWSKLGSLFTGYDTEELQAQSATLDDQLATLNQEAHTTGKIDQATYEATVQHLAAEIQATQQIPDDVNQAWVEGALEGYHNELAVLEAIPEYAGKITGDVLGAVTRGAAKGLGSIGGGLLGNIPWWVWVGGATALFFYFGGGKVVRYQVGRKVRQYSGE